MATVIPFGPASASEPSLTLSSDSGTSGQKVGLTGNGFQTKIKVQVTWDGSPSGMPTAQVNQIGTFKTSFVVPSGAAGSHTVTVAEVSSAGKTKAVSAAIAAVTFTLMALIATTAPTTAPTHPVVLGARIPGAPSNPTLIDAYASLTGTMPHIVMWYQNWSGTWNAFDATGADAVRARGAMPEITWEPWAEVVNDPSWYLSTIIDGSHDAYIHQWTADVAAWGHPIYVRPMHEMNLANTPWGYGVNGNTAAQFVSAWRHIVDIARAEGATNIRWVWCPNETDGQVAYSALYPGDAYVDWLGLDGYNWGTTLGGSWQSLSQVFQSSYDEITALSTKPLMIGETASTELGGDKAAWVTTGFAYLLASMSRVRAVVWFDANKEMDWRIDSSTRSLNAFRAVATSNAFAATLP